METFKDYLRNKRNSKKNSLGHAIRIVATMSVCLGIDGRLFGLGILGTLLGMIIGIIIANRIKSPNEKTSCKADAIFASIFVFSIFLTVSWFLTYLIFDSDFGKYIGAFLGLVSVSNVYSDLKNPKKEEEYDESSDYVYDEGGNNITSEVNGSYNSPATLNIRSYSWEDESEEENYQEEAEQPEYDYTDRGACCGNCIYYFGWGGEGECRGNMPDVPIVYGSKPSCARWRYNENAPDSFRM